MPLNKVMLIGRLGQDPDLKYTEGGNAYVKFSLATSESWKNKEGDTQKKTCWHNILAWGKIGERMAKYLKKGQEVYLEGKIDNGKYEKDGETRYSSQVVVTNFIFVGSKEDNKEKNTSTNDAPPKEEEKPMKDESITDEDDLPF